MHGQAHVQAGTRVAIHMQNAPTSDGCVVGLCLQALTAAASLKSASHVMHAVATGGPLRQARPMRLTAVVGRSSNTQFSLVTLYHVLHCSTSYYPPLVNITLQCVAYCSLLHVAHALCLVGSMSGGPCSPTHKEHYVSITM